MPSVQRWGDYPASPQPSSRTVGPGSSFRHTPPSAHRSRLPPRGPRATDGPRAAGAPLRTPRHKDYDTVWLPWWTVRGREPTRMERWAAYLLPPLEMGEEYDAVGGEVGANLHVIDATTYDVVSSVVTRYRRARAMQDRRRPQVSHNLVTRLRGTEGSEGRMGAERSDSGDWERVIHGRNTTRARERTVKEFGPHHYHYFIIIS